MGVPTSEVGYTPAMPRREDHEVHKDMWWHWIKKIFTVFTTCFGVPHSIIRENFLAPKSKPVAVTPLLSTVNPVAAL